jgi:hypothetical protein
MVEMLEAEIVWSTSPVLGFRMKIELELAQMTLPSIAIIPEDTPPDNPAI